MLKKVLAAIALILALTFVFISCGSSKEKKHVHDYYHGKCTDCGEISEEAMEQFTSISSSITWIMWYMNYETSPNNEDIRVEFSSVKIEGNKAYTEGYTVTTLSDGSKYRVETDITYVWDEDENKFVRESSVPLGDPCEVNNYDEYITYKFTSTDTYVLYNNSIGKRVSELVFYPSGSVTQYTYNVYGYVVSTTYAKYSMKKTPKPKYYTITVTADNGVEQTMIYYENLGISWNNNTYIKPVY